ncbi:MAG TPA: hypothetical protein VE954_38200 [Oligoflexus sp.]|uniref:hypothetical protein n=1 Tax=Oligoflexus sp. TaxID=1971216 RepID=UPI002D5E2D74|nr:hypothetical protein [Oligoflexus sp.]HYX38972.1 hypothetical protein [Oligoflexus sp.]
MKKNLGQIAAAMVCALAARDGFSMDVQIVKDKKTGKEYFCANAKCAGNSVCMGAGNDACGSNNKCAKTLGHPIGWTDAPDKKICEENGAGKWMLFKKEYSIKAGNVAPLAKAKPTPKK